MQILSGFRFTVFIFMYTLIELENRLKTVTVKVMCRPVGLCPTTGRMLLHLRMHRTIELTDKRTRVRVRGSYIYI